MRIIVVGDFLPNNGNAPFRRINAVVNSLERLYEDCYWEKDIISLNAALLKHPRFIFFYPLFFFITFYRCAKILLKIKKGKEFTIIYFYGRNFSLLLSVYLFLRYKSNNMLIVDHVEHPLYLYKMTAFISNLRFDQLIGYPLLWKLSDVNLIITKSFLKSNFLSKSTIYLPILIMNTLKKPEVSTINKEQISFLMISSLTSRDSPENIEEFINKAQQSRNVVIHIVGRFRNKKLEDTFYKTPNVQMHKNADEKTKNELLRSADYFILFRNFRKAEYYSSPTRLAEFLEYQKPILVNQSNFIEEVIGIEAAGYHEMKSNENIDSIVQNLSRTKKFNLDNYNKEISNSMQNLRSIISIYINNH